MERIVEQQKAEFLEVLQKIDKENPDKADIQKAASMIKHNPHLWEIERGVAGNILKNFINKISQNKSHELFIEAEILSIKERLGYDSASQIEKLIIDQILICWAGLNYAGNRASESILKEEYSYRMNLAEYWQHTLTRYQNRFLRAIETLARVRRLNKGVAFQVNIAANGGQQVNVNEDKKGP